MNERAYNLAGSPKQGVDPAMNIDNIRPVPRISIQAFCDSTGMIDILHEAAADRRMSKAHVKGYAGGIPAAIEFYASAPTPNVILIETELTGNDLIHELGQLADVCDANTKVLIIAYRNDVGLYRELIRQGISEYVVGPVNALQVIQLVSDLFNVSSSEPLGRVYAVIGGKGGVGASTIAHNVAWSFASRFQIDTVLADLDLPFGTANLDYNQDPAQGIGDAVFSPDRIDDVFLDRILSKCADHLSLLAAPSTLDKAYDLDEMAFERVTDLLRQGVPASILDVPHTWNAWTRKVLAQADEVVLVCTPDLANLRNSKNIVDFLQQNRPNDKPPFLILNQVGVPKKPEIPAADFIDALKLEPIYAFPFEPQLFGSAANNGQMIAEAMPKHPITEAFDFVAQIISGRAEIKKQKRQGLAPFLERLRISKGE